MAPKVIHRIWFGQAQPPPAFTAATCAWRDLFPDYELRLWTDDDIPRLALPYYWRLARTYAERADIARYHIMSHYGGIYADCDVVPLTRFDFLWSSSDSDVLFEEAPQLIWNGLFVTTPGSLVMTLAKGLSARSARLHSPDAAPNVRTGPYVFSAAASYARDIKPHGIRVYPPGFVHVRGQPQAHAIASAPFRDPPDWAKVADHVGTAPARPPWISLLPEAILLARIFPVRARRRLRAWREPLWSRTL